MPTLTRYAIFVLLMTGLFYTAVWAFATFVQPAERTVTITIPIGEAQP